MIRFSLLKMAAFLKGKIVCANRVSLAQLLYNSILCYVVSPCVGGTLYFASMSRRRGVVRGNEIKNSVGKTPEANYAKSNFWDWSNPDLKAAAVGFLLLLFGFFLGSVCMKYRLGR